MSRLISRAATQQSRSVTEDAQDVVVLLRLRVYCLRLLFDQVLAELLAGHEELTEADELARGQVLNQVEQPGRPPPPARREDDC
jgi:hypothetical protein